MNIKKKQEIGSYNEYVEETMPKTHTFSSCIRDFWWADSSAPSGREYGILERIS